MTHHVLLIDDDNDEFLIFNKALDTAGVNCDCTHAASYEKAIKMLKCMIPHFILLDYNMPKMNGLRCLLEIKQTEQLRDIPVIMYSNYVDFETEKKAKQLGASACIQKPTNITQLSEIMKDLVTSFNMILPYTKL